MYNRSKQSNNYTYPNCCCKDRLMKCGNVEVHMQTVNLIERV